MLTPRAARPPSAKNRHWTMSTTATHNAPVNGPTSTAASVPPSRCPLVPAATGKFSICTANTKTATRPASGAPRSSSSWRAPLRHAATPAAATAPAATDTGASMNPSGTCTAAPFRTRPFAGRRVAPSLTRVARRCNFIATAGPATGCGPWEPRLLRPTGMSGPTRVGGPSAGRGRAVRADTGVPVQAEPPRVVGRGTADPRACAGPHDRVRDRRSCAHPQPRRGVARVGPVAAPVDAEGRGQPRRATSEVTGADVGPAAAARQFHPRHDRAGAHQHRLGRSGRGADQVHAPVHAVREVHVDVPGRAEHRGVAGGAAAVGVRPWVRRAGVGLYLGQPYGDETVVGVVLDDAAEQVARDGEHRAIEEGARQRRRRAPP